MAEPKKNKDGLVGGQLVDHKTHHKIELERRKAKEKTSKSKSQK